MLPLLLREVQRDLGPLSQDNATVVVDGILAVLGSLKSAYLYDVGYVDPVKLANVVTSVANHLRVHHNGMPVVHTSVVVITKPIDDDDSNDAWSTPTKSSKRTHNITPVNEVPVHTDTVGVFVVHQSLIHTRLLHISQNQLHKTTTDTTIPIFLDVTYGRKQISRVSGAISELITTTCNSIANSLLSFDDSCKYSNACQVINITGEQWPYVVIFGIFLGYPVVYYSSDSLNRCCLGGSDLDHLCVVATRRDINLIITPKVAPLSPPPQPPNDTIATPTVIANNVRATIETCRCLQGTTQGVICFTSPRDLMHALSLEVSQIVQIWSRKTCMQTTYNMHDNVRATRTTVNLAVVAL